ncbi:MAG: TIGR03619 family F420-dependent LLM class oxidoreductase [Acidimicrobiia bacterium]|nr:TIGR03619 family F420-dependent LLM class oxidoreductase [Acidimicrobiia bacterium]
MATTPAQLSIQVRTFFQDDPGDWEFLLEHCEAADEAGIDRIVVSDHVAYGEDLEAYSDPKKGGSAGGKQPTDADGNWLEPLIFLTAVGARTARVRLGTAILIAALRRPVVLAKTLATMDVLTNGRIDLGIGVGWQKEEYDAAGLDFDARGRLLDHTIEVCRELWTQRVADYDSPELRFERIHQMPKPRQAGGIPIWVSGTINARVVRRIADYGSGWIPWGPDGADLVTAIPRLRQRVADAGGDPGFQVQGHAPAVRNADGSIDVSATMDAAAPLIEAGVTDLRMPAVAPTTRAEALETYGTYVTEFRARFA